jgi:hypothetical protein
VRTLAALSLALAVSACSEPDPEILATTVLGSTHDTAGPYRVDAIVRNVAGDDEVVLRVGIDTGNEDRFFPRAMAEDDTGERFTAAISGQPAGTSVVYFIEVIRDGDRVAIDPDSNLVAGYGFQVLAPDGACTVDSECAAGAEVCDGGTCVLVPGICDDSDDCPAGYGCDPGTESCAPAPRACDDDTDCTTSDECDLAAGVCAPRHLCSESVACPGGYTCNAALGRCFSTV